MENEKLLSEERYQRNKKKIKIIALIVLIIGLIIGVSLILKGISNKNNVNSEYSEENKQNQIDKIKNDIATEENILKNKKQELINKGIEYSVFSNYEDGEAYDLKIITKALDPSFNNCAFDEYKNNSLTSKYCSLKNQLKEVERIDLDFEKDFNGSSSIIFFIIGGFIILVSCMISGSIYMFAKGRDIMAFSTQQVMPVAQEGIEKMTPTIGKAAGTIGKDIAKGITSGIKEGLKDDDKE